jgi:hypothetical protein
MDPTASSFTARNNEKRPKHSLGDPQCRRQECSVLENSGVRATSSHLEHRLPEMGCTGNPPTIICRSRHSIAGYPKP